MRQRFILVALFCSLRIHSADKISRKNLVLTEKSRPTLVKELKYEEKKGGAVKHGYFTEIETGALFKRRRYFGGRKYKAKNKKKDQEEKWMLQELISIYSFQMLGNGRTTIGIGMAQHCGGYVAVQMLGN